MKLNRGGQFLDISNQRYGRLTAIKRTGMRGCKHLWLCICDCGNEKDVAIASLRDGSTRSCGCLARENLHCVTHGKSHSSEYNTWHSMIQRCVNPNAPCYHNYGGRGINVCDRWMECFDNFYKDMGNKPTPHHSIERIDNNKGYCKGNCVWADRKQQQNNLRSNVLITKDGLTMNITQWSEKIGIKRSTIYNRILRGWSYDESLITKLGRK
jgi:hypothetical protein